MKTLLKLATATEAPRATVLVRFMVGAVFFEEGIQKFLFPDLLGAGRFARIGIPVPEVMGPFVGTVEIVCGALIFVGLLTRLAAIPLLFNISVAILSTKIPILLMRILDYSEIAAGVNHFSVGTVRAAAGKVLERVIN